MSIKSFDYFSNVNDAGELQKNVRLLIANDLQQFIGKRVHIKISKQGAKRSDRQNRYLHLLFTIFTESLNDLGNEYRMEEVKELCKAKFAMIDVVNESTGEVIGQRIQKTSEMTKTELSEFIEKIIRWAADMFHIVLPYPNENFALDL